MSLTQERSNICDEVDLWLSDPEKPEIISEKSDYSGNKMCTCFC